MCSVSESGRGRILGHRHSGSRLARYVPGANARPSSVRYSLTSTGLSASALIYLNTPDFEKVAGATFKGVEVAEGALPLNSEQTHFYVAVRAEKQRLDRFFRGHVGLWERANVSHAMHPLLVGCAAPVGINGGSVISQTSPSARQLKHVFPFS
jgi:hypothetical protein